MKDLLLPLLTKEQKEHGYISESAMKRISKETGIPISRIYGATTFYSMFDLKKRSKHVIRICTSPSCTINGVLNLLKFFEKELKLIPNGVTKNKKFALYEASCIGCCDEAPAMLLDGKPYTNLTEKKLKTILNKYK